MCKKTHILPVTYNYRIRRRGCGARDESTLSLILLHFRSICHIEFRAEYLDCEFLPFYPPKIINHSRTGQSNPITLIRDLLHRHYYGLVLIRIRRNPRVVSSLGSPRKTVCAREKVKNKIEYCEGSVIIYYLLGSASQIHSTPFKGSYAYSIPRIFTSSVRKRSDYL